MTFVEIEAAILYKIMSLDQFTAGAYNRNINKHLECKLVWLCETAFLMHYTDHFIDVIVIPWA